MFSESENYDDTRAPDAGKLVPLMFGQDEPVLAQESSASRHDPPTLSDPALPAVGSEGSFVHTLKYVHAKDKSYVTARDDGKQKLQEPCCVGALFCVLRTSCHSNQQLQ
jgi:hypothetical protein